MLKKKPAPGAAKAIPVAKAVPTAGKQPSKSKAAPETAKRGGEPADAVLDIVHGLEPPVQGLLHRFSLHLQASIARRAINWLGLVVAINTVAIVLLAVFASSSIKIIAVDAGGRLYDVVAKREGALEYTDSQVATFGSDVVFDAFDLNFANYDRRLQRLTDTRFTNSGKSQFMVAMQDILRTLQQTKGFLIVQMPEGRFGEVVAKNGDSQWTVQVPIILTLKPASGEPVTNTRLVTLIIDRVDDYTNLKGIAVNQIVVQGGA